MAPDRTPARRRGDALPPPTWGRRHDAPSGRWALRLVPFLIAVHNLEEALAARGRLPDLQAQAPAMIAAWLPPADARGFTIALVIVAAIPLVLAAWGNTVRPASARGYALLAVQAAMLLNVASHVVATVRLGAYVPGVVSAVAVNLPWSVYLLRRAWREGWHEPLALWALIPIAVILHGPILVVLLLVSQRIASFL